MPKQKREPEFITAEEFVLRLSAFLVGAKNEDTVEVKEIRVLLDRVQIGGRLSTDNLRITLTNRLREFADNNNGAGLSASTLWKGVQADYPVTRLEDVEEVLTDMVEAGEVTEETGHVTTYVPVVEPLLAEKS